jgi:GntR family transcriptional regulator
MAHLNVSLDRASDVPLGTQLAWRLKALIASGEVAEGERLPGVREMATLAGVNVNTVRSVYARLADQGLIVSEHGRGTFVSPHLPPRDELSRLAGEVADSARRAGIDPRELALALYAGPPSAPPEARGAPSSEGRRRATLRAEIAMLERELSAFEMTAGVGEPAKAGTPTPQLLGAAELEAIRDELVERLQPLRADRALARGERERGRAEHVERELERHKAGQTGRQRAIATSTPRFESGAGGWSLRWRG